jgi:hypothetical protein
MCYQTKTVSGVCSGEAPTNAGGVCAKEQDCGGGNGTQFCGRQPKFQKVVGLYVSNQLWLGQVDATKESEFCAPATITHTD